MDAARWRRDTVLFPSATVRLDFARKVLLRFPPARVSTAMPVVR
jgi:hypothetical protein